MSQGTKGQKSKETRLNKISQQYSIRPKRKIN
jgi:hypothetical protein